MISVKWKAALVSLVAPCITGALDAQVTYTPYQITTIAGTGDSGGSDDGPGGNARFVGPVSVAVDSSGNVYVADSGNSTIRKVSPAGNTSTLAGLAGSPGWVDGNGSAARFNNPSGIAVDSVGNVYVADSGNEVIRRISPDGTVTTVAGTPGAIGSADGPALAARFNFPTGVAVDGAGTLYVSDEWNQTIRKISAGAVSTLAGSPGAAGSADGAGSTARFYEPEGIAIDASGNLFVADSGNHTIRRIASDGSVTTVAGTVGVAGYQDGAVSAAQFHNPNGVAVDSSGNILVADSGNNVIRRIAPDGTVATVAGRPGPYGAGYADGNGNQAGFNFPAAICLDSTANAYVADYFNNAVRKVTPAAAVSTLAGSPYPNGSADGRGRNAEFSAPSGAALDSLGRLYVADTGNSTIRLITPDGTVTTVAGTAGSIGSSDGAGAAARFNHPMGVAVDGEGNVYVADTGNNTIRKISTQGAVTTIAGVPGTGGAVDGPASSAQFNTPRGLALDSAGNVFIADSWNHAIRRLSTSGQVSTFAGQTGSPGSADGTGTAAQFDAPTGLAFDVHGNLYVADRINSTIRVITPQGVVTTLAGLAPTTGIIVEETDGPGYNDGVGSGARFYNPSGVAVDALGNIFVADSFNNTIRRVKPDGTVTTLAGAAPFTGWQDGVGSAARFSYPIGIAVAVDGTLWITDGDGTTVRNGAALPEFSRNPSSQTVVSGRTVVFSVAVTESSAAPTYQWSFNDMLIPGATDSALLVRGASAAQAGNYTCSVTNSAGTTTTPAATLTVVNTTDPGRLINLSCRSLVGTGANVLIAGFVVGGNGTSGSETLLVRASGPALVPFDVTGVLPDPDLQLISSNSNSLVAANNGWGGSALISTTAAAVGAFPWTDTSSHDSALVETLLPGPYTALVAGASGDSGIALAEIYDATPTGTYSPTTPRLINISARTQVGLGANVLIAGFVIGGTTSETVLIRASGPALVPFGVSSVLPDPQLQLNSSASVIATNAGWGGDAQIASTAASIGAFSWGTTATADSALLVTLPPGAYTAEVSGKSGDTGIALVEVYEVQ